MELSDEWTLMKAGLKGRDALVLKCARWKWVLERMLKCCNGFCRAYIIA